MHDEMDVYIQRRLKNWAAVKKPAVNGRKRLLRAVVLGDLAPKQASIWQFWPKSQAIDAFQDEQFHIPYTQTKYWSFHLATSTHLAM
jgi:hypothetical protein